MIKLYFDKLLKNMLVEVLSAALLEQKMIKTSVLFSWGQFWSRFEGSLCSQLCVSDLVDSENVFVMALFVFFNVCLYSTVKVHQIVIGQSVHFICMYIYVLYFIIIKLLRVPNVWYCSNKR